MVSFPQLRLFKEVIMQKDRWFSRICSATLVVGVILVVGMLLAFGPNHYSGPAISNDEAPMSVEALEKMPKIDVHAHISDFGDKGEESLIAMLEKHNFKWLDICVVGTEWEKLQR